MISSLLIFYTNLHLTYKSILCAQVAIFIFKMFNYLILFTSILLWQAMFKHCFVCHDQNNVSIESIKFLRHILCILFHQIFSHVAAKNVILVWCAESSAKIFPAK